MCRCLPDAQEARPNKRVTCDRVFGATDADDADVVADVVANDADADADADDANADASKLRKTDKFSKCPFCAFWNFLGG